MEKKITVFTSTYNRGHLLSNLYNSLIKQTNKNFKWLIVDDGSIDNTKSIVQRWIKENKIEITYCFKENGGLHTGYNKAIELLDTELAVCIDSDDWMTDDAIDVILDFWENNKSDEYAGIIGLDVDKSFKIVGDYLPNVKSINPVLLLANHCRGDKKYVVRSDLYKKVAPMPVFDNEKNFNPHYMILKLSKQYKFLILNQPLCIVDYQEDGMSANIYKQYLDSPNSFVELRKVIMELNPPFFYSVKTTIHYVSSCIIAKRKHIIRTSPNKILTFFCFPFGYLLKIYIKKNETKVLNMR